MRTKTKGHETVDTK